MFNQTSKTIITGILFSSIVSTIANAEPQAGTSPWGPTDEIGALNKMTDKSRLSVLKKISSGKVYDLSVEYYVGMPSYDFNGQPRYQIWNVHTPKGTIVDNTTGLGKDINKYVTYSGTAISMYSHTGTHIDALAHFGLNGKIYNGFTNKEHLGDRGWKRSGVEKYPPIVARGILVDVAAYKKVKMLPDSYGITTTDIDNTLAAQGVKIREGDIVIIRTGRMSIFKNRNKYMNNTPGLTRESANHLVNLGAILVAADNISTDVLPSKESPNYIPVHSSLLTERGVPIMQNVYAEDLSKDKVYKFAWIGASLKLRGSDGGPMRPIAIPIQ